MTNRLVQAAVLLEERMHNSSLHKMYIYHAINVQAGLREQSVVSFLASERDALEEIVKLENAFDANLVSEGHFVLRFPDILYLAVNAHYAHNGFRIQTAHSSEGAMLVIPGHENMLTNVTIELCRGSGYSRDFDEGKPSFTSDLVVGAEVSPEGKISKVWKGSGCKRLPFRLKGKAYVTEAFEMMEGYVLADNRRL